MNRVVAITLTLTALLFTLTGCATMQPPAIESASPASTAPQPPRPAFTDLLVQGSPWLLEREDGLTDFKLSLRFEWRFEEKQAPVRALRTERPAAGA